VDSVVPESRITFDTRFFGQNIIVLAFEIANYLLEGKLVINVIAKTWGIDNGERDTNAILFKFDVEGFNSDAFLDVGSIGVVRYLVG